MDSIKNREKSNYSQESDNNEFESYIGKSVRIKGNIASEESILVEGKTNGSINVKDILTIGESGDVSGKIEADSINVKGKVRGEIKTSQKLRVLSTANIKGDIFSDSIIIQEGGVFNGNMNMSEKEIK